MLPGLKLFDLSSMNAIVTGGSKGLGQAMAAGLASAGSNLVLVSRNQEEVEETARQISADFGVRAIGIQGDVTRAGDCAAIVERTLSEFGSIEILINNAGINIRGSIEELTLEEFQQVQRVNVDGIWLMSRAVVTHMKQKEYGRIINMASTLGVVGLSNRTPYASSKGAVVQMTRALGLELARDGICVNAICPGPFLTPMNIPIAEDEQTRKFIVGAVALERWGNLEEIQGAAIFLSSPAA
ncbi:MAG: SDR family oxidoreductase, partial [Planctomycetota bacterium]|nr:SDR family oxidoreductase [Planctomycetota bacterium]